MIREIVAQPHLRSQAKARFNRPLGHVTAFSLSRQPLFRTMQALARDEQLRA